MDFLAIVLLLVVPVAFFVAFRLSEAAIAHPVGPDFLAVAAFREAASFVASVVFAVLGVHILTGRTLYPPSVGVALLVVAVMVDRLAGMVWIPFLRRWDREGKAD
jgi:hypothetical protein